MQKLLTLGLVLFITACTSDNKSVFPVNSLAKPPLNFNVAAVEYIIAADPAFEDRFRKRQAYPEFAAALQNWSQRTFINRGQKGTLLVTIEQADIKETAIPKKHHGLKGVFTYDPSEKYDGMLTIRLEIKDENGLTKETTLTTVTHSIMVLENISLDKRQRKIDELMQTLIMEMDERLRTNIEEHLMGHISY